MLDEQEAWQLSWAHLLRTARQVAGKSLTALAAETGLSKGYLSKLESGRESALNPSRATLAALARALPSFRALAHMLDPDLDVATPALARAEPQLPPIVRSLATDRDAAGDAVVPSPVRLGWKELEVVTAVLAIEQAALRVPLTRVTVGRAVGRPVAEIEPVLDGLVRMGVLVRLPPRHAGLLPVYARSDAFAERTGITRLGDALLLAAALLSQAPRLPARAVAGATASMEGDDIP
ncbi:MAG TPA: helix-turn-helix transcriptional regulator [Ktedonobacterales bacterium]